MPMHSQVLCLVRSAGVAGLLLASARGQERTLPPEVLHYADLILVNGKVLTADNAFTVAEALAVRDGRILAVGRSERIRLMAGPRTRTLDLQQKTVIPGFIDTHFHLHNVASRGNRLSVDGRDIPAALADVKKLVAVTPPGQVIYARIDAPRGQASKVEWELTRWQLDAVSPEHPVILDPVRSRLVVNTLALKGVDLPPGTPGVIMDPVKREPNGQMEDMAYGVVRTEYAPWIPIEKMIPQLIEGMKQFNARGVTTATTRVPGNELTALREIWKDKALTMRWRVHLEDLIDENPRAEGYLKRIGNLSDIGDDLLRIVGAHGGAADGQMGEGTASMSRSRLRPIPADEPMSWVGAHGWDRWPKEQMGAVVAAVRYGWNVMGIHNEGDAASNKVLQAFEEGRKTAVVRTRHQRLGIDHWPMADSEQIERARRLGGVYTNASVQQLFLGTDRTTYFYGADSMQGWLPLKTLIAAGLKPTLAMDGPGGVSANPFWQIEKVIVRKDDKGRVWNPSEAVSRKEALWMYTNWSSRYIGDEDRLGTLEPGKLADLVVLDRDYMTVPEEEISKIRAVMTFLEGKLVYEEPVRSLR